MQEPDTILLIRTSIGRHGPGLREFLRANPRIAAAGMFNTKTRLVDGFVLPATSQNKKAWENIRATRPEGVRLSERKCLQMSLWMVGRTVKSSFSRDSVEQNSEVIYHSGQDASFNVLDSFVVSNNNLHLFLPGRGPGSYRLFYSHDKLAMGDEVTGLLKDILDEIMFADVLSSARAAFFVHTAKPDSAGRLEHLSTAGGLGSIATHAQPIPERG